MQSTRVAKSAPPITMNLVVKYDEQTIKANEVMVPDVDRVKRLANYCVDARRANYDEPCCEVR